MNTTAPISLDQRPAGAKAVVRQLRGKRRGQRQATTATF